jgi:hypothetical protein
MKPVELHIYDFDGALYDSPRPRVDRPHWWFSAKSLTGWKPPGRDRKWILDTVMQARRSIQSPWVMTALLTGRPRHASMVKTIRRMLFSAGLHFNEVQLKPLIPPQRVSTYKALAVVGWLQGHPAIRKVTFYDDLPENLAAVGEALHAYDPAIEYTPRLTQGVT